MNMDTKGVMGFYTTGWSVWWRGMEEKPKIVFGIPI
jgi:hypothetical protein